MPIEFSAGETKELNVELTPIAASLKGQVIDAQTSEPIIGALVEVVDIASTTTGIDGRYSITNIPPGSYTVRFSHSDYETVEY